MVEYGLRSIDHKHMNLTSVVQGNITNSNFKNINNQYSILMNNICIPDT